ncbi:GMC family oxidoreductase N-terminal domain-containing protein [Croceibacterium sp. LX-88]|uniref:GMC family oxidoreductase N-terminal domain-containing protein n=1 Tax=Croceibacterium selenioxidans TaxID=2838833 RepID=A0ABS5W8X5_9SPHN|nr:GMC family oxidoreductase N-terminal domain-containing protein [Croceibacterium selenioxidans]MBT2135660.1 GMC family oxidoreductase N-terminal domain-containing protein [Croceibacterium selenioxidans]
MEGQFDYVIVGAGSAGSVLAARLTEDPNTRVLLLEAGGGADKFLIKMPLGMMKAMLKPELTWRMMTEPEPTLNNRRLFLPRGRLLGGSSSINGMVYMRGHSADYDRWAQKGCRGWSHSEVVPYFRRMERSWRGTENYGASGPLPVTKNNTEYLLHDELMQAVANAGLPVTEDIHAGAEEGASLVELTIDEKGRRASTYEAYLKPAMARPNLAVVTHALTRKVVVEDGRATGVEYEVDGEVRVAKAAREVILSGGSYNSPQLLMLSGIGPAEHLAEMGIPLVHNLPGVGRNLSEHPRVPLEFAANGPITFVNQLRFDRAARAVAQWYLFGTGPFARQLNSANPMLRTDPRLAQPDIQLFSNPVKLSAHLWFPGFVKSPEHAFSADVILLHPQARGWVSLKSADPHELPAIRLNLFDNEADFVTARAGLRLARKIYGTEPMAGLIERESIPGAEVQSDAAMDEHIRATAGTTQHPVGTCAMGTGPNAVVDPELRVHGLAGLRVIDASIMPDVPGGNTNGPTIMVAEKASDLIRGRSLPAVEKEAA